MISLLKIQLKLHDTSEENSVESGVASGKDVVVASCEDAVVASNEYDVVAYGSLFLA